jgi:hypothetical protein
LAQRKQEIEIAVWVGFQALGNGSAQGTFGQQIGKKRRGFDCCRLVAAVQQQGSGAGFVVRACHR